MWLKDKSMKPILFSLLKKQPGINGLAYAEQFHFLYYTSTARRLFMRVRVDPATLNPVSTPLLVAKGHQWDDFAINEQAGAAYITTHREVVLACSTSLLKKY